MDETTQGRVSRDEIDVSKEVFVPALFIPWASPVRAETAAYPGQSVRDASRDIGALAHSAHDSHEGAPAAVSRSGLKSVGRLAALRAMWRTLGNRLLGRYGVAHDG